MRTWIQPASGKASLLRADQSRQSTYVPNVCAACGFWGTKNDTLVGPLPIASRGAKIKEARRRDDY